MCELITKWGPAEWSGIIQAVGAVIASVFLFLTFNSQKKSEKLMKETANMDKRAKRAEYLPEINISINTLEPVKQLYDGSLSRDAFNGENTTVEVKLNFSKNAVQILDFEFLKLEKYIQFDIYPFPFDIKKILLPGEAFEVKFYINLQQYFGLVNEDNDPFFSGLVESTGIDYRGKIYLRNILYFADMLGNKYQFKFNIGGLNTLHSSELKMID